MPRWRPSHAGGVPPPIRQPRRAIMSARVLPGDQHALRRPSARTRRPADGARRSLGGRPGLAFVAGESGVGKTRLVAELERVARADGVRVIGGDCVELGEGELPYAPIVARAAPARARPDTRRSARSRARAGRARAASSPVSAPLDAGAATRPPPTRGCSRRCWSCWSGSRGDGRACCSRSRTCTGPTASTRAFLRLPRRRRCPRARARRHHLPARRAAPPPPAAAAAGRARARRPRAAGRAAPAHPRGARRAARRHPRRGPRPPTLLDRLLARSEGNPLFAEELLAAGTDGRGSLPPTLRDALMLRIERLSPDAQELLRRARRRPAARPRDPGARRSGADPRVPGCARRSPRRSSSPTTRASTRSATRCCARWSPTTCCPASAPSCTSRSPTRWRRAPPASPPTAGAPRRGDRAPLPRVRRPAGRARRVGARRAGRRGRARLRRGRRAVLARARALGPRAERPSAGGRRPRRAAALGRRCHRRERAGPGRGPAARPRWPRSTRTPTATAAAGARARSRASSGCRAAPRSPTRPGRARSSCCPRSAQRGERDGCSPPAKQLMLESRHGRRSMPPSARSRWPAPPASRSPSCVRWTPWASRSSRSAATTRASARCARCSTARGPSGGDAQRHLNLADSLAVAGRLAEARLSPTRGTSSRRPRHRAAGSTLLRSELALEAGDVVGRRGRAARAARGPRWARPSSTTRCGGSTSRSGAADHERSGCCSTRRRSRRRHPRAAVDRPAGRARAELERRAGDLEAARAAIDDALDRLEFCSEDVARMARGAAGVRVEADAACGPRDLAEEPGACVGIGRGAGHPRGGVRRGRAAGRARSSRRRGPSWPRAQDARRPALLGRARPRRGQALGRPYHAAQAQLPPRRGALARGDREARPQARGEALAARRAIGAAWLRVEVEGLRAARAAAAGGRTSLHRRPR